LPATEGDAKKLSKTIREPTEVKRDLWGFFFWGEEEWGIWMRFQFRHRVFLVVVCSFLILVLSAGAVLAGPLVVAVDPGHGGRDPGALGYSGTQEKTINLDIALRLQDLMQKTGVQVVMTREQDAELGWDYYTELSSRVDVANRAEADLFVSVHSNSTESSGYNGTEVYSYGGGVSREVARFVLDNLVSAMGTKSNGVKEARYFVLRNTIMPSILVETGYISNPDEEAKLNDPEFRQRAAEGIFRGLAAYYGLDTGDTSQPGQPGEPGQTDPPGQPGQPDLPGQPGDTDPDRDHNPSRGGSPDPFIDISRHYARRNIISLTSLGVIKEEGRRFYPNRAITRAELVAMLARMLDLKSSSQTSFPDVSPDFWAADAIAAAKEAKLLAGYSDGRFYPDRPITRAEVAVVMSKALVLLAQAHPEKAANSKVTKKFADAGTHWAKDFIYALTSAGIIQGYKDGSFKPKQSVTRGETVELIARMLDPTQRL